jgi:hypothetical protein
MIDQLRNGRCPLGFRATRTKPVRAASLVEGGQTGRAAAPSAARFLTADASPSLVPVVGVAVLPGLSKNCPQAVQAIRRFSLMLPGLWCCQLELKRAWRIAALAGKANGAIRRPERRQPGPV